MDLTDFNVKTTNVLIQGGDVIMIMIVMISLMKKIAVSTTFYVDDCCRQMHECQGVPCPYVVIYSIIFPSKVITCKVSAAVYVK